MRPLLLLLCLILQALDAAAHCPEVSIIIPVLNEEERIASLVVHLQTLHPAVQIILVDGGSKDGTLQQILQTTANCVQASLPCRGAQMNLGAASATGSILLFLHADTHLPQASYTAMLKALKEPFLLGGAFSLRFEEGKLIPLEKAVFLRNYLLGLAYGDQGYFIKRSAFEPFCQLPLMEDVEWFLRLKATGRYTILDEPVYTSPRRILRKGLIRSSLTNFGLVTLFFLGVSPETLARIYYSS